MSGVRLEAKIHIVTAAVTSAQNIVKCANKAGLNVVDIVLEPLASAEAVLAGDERDLGVCLIDIGGGTTDLAVFADGSIKHTSVLALGGNHITNDIAVGLRTPFDEAERIKKRFGVASARYLGSDDVITVPSVGGRRPREVSRKLLCEIIEPRDRGDALAGTPGVDEGGPRRPHPVRRRAHGRLLGARRHRGSGGGDLRVARCESACRRASGGLQDVVRDPMYATGVGLVLYGISQGVAGRTAASGSATNRSSAAVGSACATGSTGSSSSGEGAMEFATFPLKQAQSNGNDVRLPKKQRIDPGG